MKDPASPSAGREAGPRIITRHLNRRSYATPDSVPQRPFSRRKPNAPFSDDVCAASDLESLSVGVAGGARRSLRSILEELDR
jgi:hypothetical protein